MEIEDLIDSPDTFQDFKDNTVQEILKECVNVEINSRSQSMMLLLPGAISELTDSLILCSASSVNTNVLDALNITCVINVAPELPDTPLHRSDIIYHKIPVVDAGNTRIYPFFDEAADLIHKTDVVLAYEAAVGNAARARDIYRELYPNRVVPSAATFTATVQRLRDHGTFQPHSRDRGRARTDRVLELEPVILDRTKENPLMSTILTSVVIFCVASSGGKTLIYCVAGVSRSASICLSYLMKHQGLTLLDAYNYVKLKRPKIKPNCGFFKQLIEYEKEIFGNNTIRMIFNEFVQMEIPDVYDCDYQFVSQFSKKKRKQNGRY